MNQFQSFTPEEAEHILRRAAGSTASDLVSEADLVSMAAELGISPEAVQEAVQARRTEVEKAKNLADYKAHLKRKVLDEGGSWLSTSALLIGINLLTSGWQITWAIWPVGIFAVLWTAEIVKLVVKWQRTDEADVNRWLERKERKALKAQQKLQQNAPALEATERD